MLFVLLLLLLYYIAISVHCECVYSVIVYRSLIPTLGVERCVAVTVVRAGAVLDC